MLRIIDLLYPPISDTINVHVLAANTAESDTIPAGARWVIIQTTAQAFWRFGATATVPAGDIVDGSGPEILAPTNPAFRQLISAQTKGYVATGSTLLTVNSLEGMTIGNSIVVKGAGAAGVDLTTTISAINTTTSVITLGAAASTTVADAAVTSAPTTISLICSAIATITLSYYK
jgi:hypothetical protein